MGFGLPLTTLSRNTLTSDCYNLRIITVISVQSYWDTLIALLRSAAAFLSHYHRCTSTVQHLSFTKIIETLKIIASNHKKYRLIPGWLGNGILFPHLKITTVVSPNFFTQKSFFRISQVGHWLSRASTGAERFTRTGRWVGSTNVLESALCASPGKSRLSQDQGCFSHHFKTCGVFKCSLHANSNVLLLQTGF